MSHGISSSLTNDLTATHASEPRVLNYVWYDTSDSVVVDMADVSMNGRVLVADNTGLLSLNIVDVDSDDNYVLKNAVNLVDDLFVDQDGDRYLRSYETNYRSVTETALSNDIDLTVTQLNDNDIMALDTDVADLDVGNNLTIDLEALANLSSNYDISENFKVVMDTELDFLSTANVEDISNNLTINMYHLGAEVADKSFEVNQVGATLSVVTNALSDNAVLKFTSDASENNGEFLSYPKPSILCANMLKKTYAIGAGRNTNKLDIAIPANSNGFISGAWNWNVTVVDGDYESPSVPLRLQVLPRFSEPITNLPASLNFQRDVSLNIPFWLKYKPSDITNLDISAWNQTLNTDPKVQKYNSDTGKWENYDTNYLGLDAHGTSAVENLSAARDTDASDNHTLVYHTGFGKYNMVSESLRLRVQYGYDPANYVSEFTRPINIAGADKHTSQVIATNNYNGTYTLSGGNKGTSEYYCSSTDSGNTWYRLSSKASTTLYNMPTTGSGNVIFGITDVKSPNAINNSVFNRSISDSVAFNPISKVTVDISNGTQFNALASDYVISIDEHGNVINSDICGNLSTAISEIPKDLYVNIGEPSWFNDTVNPSLKIDVVETPSAGVYNVLGFDLSCNMTRRAGKLVSGSSSTWSVTSDISSAEFDIVPSLDFVFRDVRETNSELLITATYNTGSKSVKTVSQARFFIKATVPVNAGNNSNNLILPNRTKVNLTKLFNGNMTRLSRDTDRDVSEFSLDDISLNTFRNMGFGVNAMAYANLVRSEFVGPRAHTFDISAFSFTATGNGEDVTAYFPFLRYGDSLTMADYDHVDAKFSNYPDIFLDLGYFTGTLDVGYNTMYNGELSNVPNTLRLIVVPRPEVTYDAIDPSQNVHRVGATSWLRHTATNTQRNANDADVAFNANRAILGGSASNIRPLLEKYAELEYSNWSVIDASNNNLGYEGPFDISDSLLDISYGNTSSAIVKYTNFDVDNNDVSDVPHRLYFNATAEYIRHKLFKDRHVSGSDSFNLWVMDDAERVLFVEELVANDIFFSGNLQLNNINFASYHIADNNLNLCNTSQFYKTLYLVVENSAANSIDVVFAYTDTDGDGVYDDGEAVGDDVVTILAGKRAVFRQTDTALHIWSHDGGI